MDLVARIQEELQSAIEELYGINLETENIYVERPGKELWGDYSSNISLTIANTLKQDPLKIAKNISYRIEEKAPMFVFNKIPFNLFKKIDFKAPGFINFEISDYFLLTQDINDNKNSIETSKSNTTGHKGAQNILFEYTDPNPFKVFHIGHLMSNAIGESLSRIIEYGGAQVKRANYQGDVGMHIAKSIWGALKKMEIEKMTFLELEGKSLEARMHFLGQAYSLGATEFELSESVKEEIKEINAQIYKAAQEMLQEGENWTPIIDFTSFLPKEPKYPFDKVKEIYIKGRAWSLEEFEVLYRKLNTTFDFYFFESMVGEYGFKIVQDGLEKNVFEKDNGAVIFNGEKYGLHTRVFINSLGLPVYETKDLGLAFLKNEHYRYDKSYIITANEIDEYFKVVLKAMGQLNSDLAQKTIHIGHGVMKFKEGKMSSRKGDVVTGKTMLEDAKQAVLVQMRLSKTSLSEKEADNVAEKMSVSAVKYSILKHNILRDIIYDQNSAISITGNTGPYLQYTHARTMSILDKISEQLNEDIYAMNFRSIKKKELLDQEISVLRHLIHFEEVVKRSSADLSPSLICEYLFELAQRFNSFYNDLSILKAEDAERQSLRLYITKHVQQRIKIGLWLLGIEALDRV